MAIFPVVDDVAQTTTDVPSSPTFLGGIAFNSAGLVHITDTASSIYVNGIPVSATGQVVYVDASAGLPAGTVYVNGLPISGGAVCMSSNAVAFYANGLPYDINGAIVATVSWSPLSLFESGEQGVWYDPSDFTTMFQDSAGITPVTAVGQPVGRILDKSKGLVLGPELVTNGAFDSGTAGWVLDTGWSITGGIATANTTLGSQRITSANQWAGQNNRTYLVTATVTMLATPNVTASVGINIGGLGEDVVVPSQTNLQSGVTYTIMGFARPTSVSSFSIRVGEGRGFNYELNYTIDNISVRELPGNHATQATAASRPVLATGVDLDGADDSMAQSAGGGSTTAFMLCAAVKPEGGAASARTIWSDAGTNTGYIVRLNASNQLEMSVGNGTAYTTIATTATVDVGTAYVVTAWDDGTNLNVQVNNGTVASVARPTVSAGTTTATLGKDNDAATGFFNGQLISVVQVKNDGGTADERTEAKAYAAGKGGVTL